MRVLYLTHANFNNPNGAGIFKKMLGQCKAFELQNWYVDLICIESESIVVKSQKNSYNKPSCKSPVIKHVELNLFIGDWVKKQPLYDIIYMRLFPISPILIFMLSRIRPHCSKIIMEIPTYPYDLELIDKAKQFYQERKYMSSYFNKGRLFFDRILRLKLSKYVDRIVCFDIKYKEIFNIPVIGTVNGIIVDDVTPKKTCEHTDTINVIAVAALATWHGYDRFLNGMGEYYKNGGARDIHFHVVGDGDVLPLYREITQRYNIQNRVTFYGTKNGQELDEIYDKCEIGIEVLGMHRKGDILSSTLKSREYWAKGLPFVTECDFPDNLDEIKQYMHKVLYDETIVDIGKFIEFYDNIYIKNGKSKQKIIDELRNFAYKACDMKVAMQPVVDYIKS